MQLPLPIAYHRKDNIEQSSQILVNLYTVQEELSGKYAFNLFSSPGDTLWTSLSEFDGRGKLIKESKAYVINGNKFISIDKNKVVTELGTLLTNATPCDLAATRNQIMIVDGQYGYIYDFISETFTRITNENYPSNVSKVTALFGLFVVAAPNTNQFFMSGFEDGLTWSATGYLTKSSADDNIIAPLAFQQELFIFGEFSTENWLYDASETLPFTNTRGIYFKWGLRSPAALKVGPSGVYWPGSTVDGDFSICQFTNGQFRTIASTAIIDELVKLSSAERDNISADIYSIKGHEFYQITLANKTFIWDNTTGLWHERKSIVNGKLGKYRLHNFFAIGDVLLANSFYDKNIYEVSPRYFTENGEAIYRRFRLAPQFSDNKFVTIYDLVLDLKKGELTLLGTGVDASMQLSISVDGGHTYGDWVPSPLGPRGNYFIMPFWNTLGSTNLGHVLDFKIVEPIPFTVMGIRADVEVGL